MMHVWAGVVFAIGLLIYRPLRLCIYLFLSLPLSFFLSLSLSPSLGHICFRTLISCRGSVRAIWAPWGPLGTRVHSQLWNRQGPSPDPSHVVVWSQRPSHRQVIWLDLLHNSIHLSFYSSIASACVKRRFHESVPKAWASWFPYAR